MDWFAKNAAAIQAIASIVGVLITAALAGITYWYVRVTREIAKSSADQTRQMKEAAELANHQMKENRRQLARNLRALAHRSRLSLESVVFNHSAMLSYTQPTEDDISEIQIMSRQTCDDKILLSANVAVVALRHVLAIVEKAGNIKPSAGWIPSQEDTQKWTKLSQGASKALQDIETQCEIIASTQ